MRSVRTCSRTACDRPAAATLTYVYADSTAVLGPLAQLAEPHSYDLCPEHAERLTAPRGWEVVRLMPEFAPTAPSTDDLVALADAVREAGRRPGPAAGLVAEPAATLLGSAEGGLGAGLEQRRGHLRVVRQDEG